MSNKTEWIVTLAGDRRPHEVATDVSAAGFAVEQLLDAIGLITGSADDDVAEKVRNVPGVSDVSRSGVVDIGPPDAENTW